LLINSVVDVKFRYWVRLRDVEFGHNKALICAYILINGKYPMHANKQLFKSDNWTLN